MTRIACVDVPALPLQILRRDRPEWAGLPLAVVEADRPQSPVLWISRSAQRLGVRVGMRYAAALGISRELRAAPVDERRVAEVRAEIVGALHRHSPRVEPDGGTGRDGRPGVFWVDPEGMTALFGSLDRWARAAWAELGALDLFGSVVVGFERMPAWAVARTCRDARVLRDAEQERTLAGAVALARLDFPHELESGLEILGATTLARFLALPRGELSVRFGTEASRLHALWSGAIHEPMEPARLEEPIAIEAELDPPDDDAARILFCTKGALHALTSALARRSLALASLQVKLALERGGERSFVLRPARATRDATTVLELMRLRLGAMQLPARVERIHLVVEAAPPEGTQLALFGGARRRDPDAASRGIARLRAAFGAEAVVRARLADGWLPEAQFRWEPTDTVALPRVIDAPHEPPLVRRVFATPRPLPADREGRPCTTPPIEAMSGPYRLQSGWWAHGAARDYWYAERSDGALLWLYRDAATARWYAQGFVD